MSGPRPRNPFVVAFSKASTLLLAALCLFALPGTSLQAWGASTSWQGFTISWEPSINGEPLGSLEQTTYLHNGGFTRYVHTVTNPAALASGMLQMNIRIPGAFLDTIYASDRSDSPQVSFASFNYGGSTHDMSLYISQTKGPGGVDMIEVLLSKGDGPYTLLAKLPYPAPDLDVAFSGPYSCPDSGSPTTGGFLFTYGLSGTRYTLDQYIDLPASALDSIPSHPEKQGGPEDNPDVAFSEHQSPGTCSRGGQGLPSFTVNTATRNLSVRDTVFRSQGLGPPLDLTMTYNADPSVQSMLGRGWRLSLDAQVELLSGGVLLRKGSGQAQAYAFNSPSPTYPASLTPPTGVFDTMTAYADRYELLDKQTRLTWVFSSLQGTVLKLGSIRDQNGNTLSVARNSDGTIASVTDAAGRQATFSYNSSKRCTAINTPDGRSVSLSYDGSGNLTGVTDLAGIATSYAYTLGNLLSAMTVAGKTTSFTYDSALPGSVASVTDALGKVTVYAANSSVQTVTRTGPDGAATTYSSTNGRTSTVSEPLGRTSSTTFNWQGLPTAVTDARGMTTSMVYDTKGDCIRSTDPKGNVTQFTYDAKSNLIAKVDPNGNTWSYAYDASGNLTSLTTPLNRTTTFSYNGLGQMLSYTLPGGGTHTFTRDLYGNLSGMADPLGNQTLMSYDGNGLNMASSTDPRGNTTTYLYDANRRLTRKTLPDGAAYRYEYDCCALSSVTDPNNHTTAYARDALLRITAKTDPLGRLTTYAYNDLGSRTSVTDPLGRRTAFGFDALQRLTTLTSPLDKSVLLGLDAEGNVTAVTNERGQTSQLSYDNAGRQATLQDPLGQTTASFTRDGEGAVSSFTNARGTTVTLIRDAEGRLTEKRYGNDTVASYGYDAAGNMNSVTDATGSRTFTHDTAGRVTALGYPGGAALSLSYDQAGNIASMTYPGGLTANYTYDSRNRVTRVAFGGNTLDMSYDAAGNLTGEQRSNGQLSVYTYDAADLLSGLTHQKGASVLASLTYTRDGAGQITAESGKWPRTPRLSGRKSVAAYNAADGVSTWGADSFSYDPDGNLIGITGSRALTAAYDAENRPSSITRAGVSTTYAYDGLGNRVRIQNASGTRNLHHDNQGRLVFETNAAGELTEAFIYAGRRLVASGTLAGGFVFHHCGNTGNTLALTNAAGDVVATFAYTPFGEVTRQDGARSTRFTYVGAYGVMDEGSGLYYMGKRYYDALTGRFLQRDPIGFAGGYNLYSYVDNNPVSRIDPLGTIGDDVGGGFDRWNNAVQSMSAQEKLVIGAVGVAATALGAYAMALADSVAVGAAAVEAQGVGVCSATSGAGSSVSTNAAKELLSKEKWDYILNLYKTYGGKIPGLDPKSSAGFDWLLNAPMPIKDKIRMWEGMVKYVKHAGTGW